jgi:hypothetical protein
MTENQAVQNSSNVILAVIFVTVFLGVMLLALVTVFYALGLAGNTAAGITTQTYVNESGWLNGSGYTLTATAVRGFNTPVLVTLYNVTDHVAVETANATLSSAGVIKNSTAKVWTGVKITYTFQNTNSTVNNAMDNIRGNTLGMAINFFALLPTIGTILAVIILIAGIVVLVMYVRRMKDSGSEGSFSG